ncbi:hypothetical protein HU200_033716 [Digitaria exilis]|uniref:Uncharacterized protein n=1 Tax=Digitaria exilis TaxID=1010633 RepID=A0A835BKM7_9POAL|nr:hypothetical protein HU200_033716 [Digitaria exilis]
MVFNNTKVLSYVGGIQRNTLDTVLISFAKGGGAALIFGDAVYLRPRQWIFLQRMVGVLITEVCSSFTSI